MPALYVIATPIGNLEDITLRALRVLEEVGLIAAEDTRTTRKLLSHYGIKTPLTNYHEQGAASKLPTILSALKSQDVALVSEAGMPGISDPGYELVRAAIKEGIAVVPVPGPSALTSALAVSGLPAEPFTYLGFLPRRRGERQHVLSSLASLPHTLVAFESPHRLLESLEDILALLGDRPIAVCRELTKLHEEVFRGSVSEAISHFAQPRGEFTLVIGGAQEEPRPKNMEEAERELARFKGQGIKAKEAVVQVAAAFGIPRREAYRLWLRID